MYRYKFIAGSFLILMILGFGPKLIAQTPKLLDYQAVIRDNNGKLLPNKAVTLRLSIIRDSPTGTIEYSEDHKVTTNQFGLVYLYIGNGTAIQGSFLLVDWSRSPKYLKVEIDLSGNLIFTELGSMQLVSVPYALFAEKSGMKLNAGKGIQIISDSINNTGDLSITNELQTISLNTNGKGFTLSDGGGSINIDGTGGTTINNSGNTILINSETYTSGTGISLNGNSFSAEVGSALWNAFKLQGYDIDTSKPSVNQVLKWNGVQWSPGTGDSTSYYAGTGLQLNGNTFFHSNHYGDISGNTSVTVLAIQNRAISAIAPSNNQSLKWNGSSWAPANDDNTTYTAGTGLSLSGTVFSNTGDLSSVNELQTVSASGTTSPAIDLSLGGGSITFSAAGGTNLSRTGNTISINSITYDAGTGITLTSNSFSHPSHSGDIAGITSVTVLALQNRAVSSVAPANNQSLKWNGSAWTPANDDNTTYTAGTGLSLTGTVFSNTGDLSSVNELQTVSASGTTSPAIDLSLGGGSITFSASGGTNLSRTGNTISINSITYDAGTGITLTSNSFSHPAHSGDITGITSVTVLALQNRAVSSASPANNQALKWNGASWAPANDDNTTYTAGTGLSLAGTVFSNTGDLSSVNELQTLSASGTTSPAIDLSLGGGSISFSASGGINLSRTGNTISINSVTYDAGTGITLASNSFSHPAHSGDIAGITSVTVLALQNRAVSSVAPSNNQALKWNGASWAPANDDNTTYTAGTGLSLAGTVFSNTGDLSSVNELQTLSASGTTSPAIDLSLGGGSISFSASGGTNLSRTGNTISINSITYDAGTGISLTSNSFSHPAHSGDIAGITSVTVLAIQGRSVSSAAPSNNQALKWNGASWAPANDDNTTYTAGTGLSLAGTVFSNTGDLSSVNELQTVSASGTTSPAIDLSLGGGSITFSASGGTNLSRTGNTISINSITYDAGTGISLTSNSFSHPAHSGDIAGITSVTVLALQNRAVSSVAPSNNQALKWNGSAWAPANDDNTTYTAGTGLSLAGTVFSNTGDLSSVNELQTVSASGTTSPAIDLSLGGGSITFSASGGTNLSRSGNTISINSITYDAGTGISLTSNSFSHPAHSGDITGITSVTVLALQNRAVSSAAPANNQALKWNGASWAPANDDNTTYTAGTGLSLAGTVFSNTGDLSSVNELQTVSASGTTSPAIDLSLGGGSISFSASGGTNLSRTGNTISINSITYDAGTGISLTSNSFSHPAHTGDITGITSVTVLALQNRAVSSVAPANNQSLKWNGSSWAPANDDNTTYTAGTGLSLSGTVFSNTGDLSSVNELQTVSASGTTSPAIDLSLGGGSITFSASGGTNLSRTGNTISINSITYDAGTGITLTSNSFSHPAHTGDIAGITSVTVLAIQGRSVSSAAPANNQALKWNGSAWTPANDDNTTYTAGTGLSLTGTVFSNTGDLSSVNELQTFSASGTTSPSIDLSLGGGSITFYASGGTNLSRTGNNIAINSVTYDAGTGITLASNSFSHPAHSGDIAGITSVTVLALQNRAVSSVAPANNQSLKWNGSAWTPANDDNTTYTAGTGLSLSGTVFSNTGDLSSVNELQTVSASGTTSPAIDLSLGGGSITFSASGGTNLSRTGNTISINSITYDAGTGITLTSNSFSHPAHSGDIAGITSVTVLAIQGRSVSSAAPANNQALKWNGASWAPANDDNTTYTAGTGLSLTGTVFSNTGDLSSVNELQTVSASGTTSPAIDLSLGGGSITFSASGGTNLSRTGNTISINSITYDAGTGITFASNSFSHPAHTGDIAGITSVTVLAIQGRSVSSAAPANNQALKWNGSAWTPANDDNTTYTAGTGLSLTGTVFSNTGDLSSVNELQTLSASGTTSPAIDLSLGGGSITFSASGGTNLSRTGNTISINSVTYDAGTGITLTSNSFSHPAHSGDIAGITSVTVLALQNRAVSSASPSNNQALKWNGSAWTPANDDNTTYSAGTGLSLSGTVFSNTGDLSSVNELQTVSASGTTSPAIDLSLGGGSITFSASGGTNLSRTGNTISINSITYDAGTGITLTSNSFSHPAHSGDIVGITSVTVLAIQGRNVSTTIPSSGNALIWNGAYWGPSLEGLMPSGVSGQTLRHDGNYWTAVSSLYNNGTNVGINTTNPVQKLDIEGNIRIPFSTALTGILYSDSIPFLHSYGNGIYLGRYAGNFTNTSSSNLAIGEKSLNSVTSGSDNISIGYFSLRSNSSGSSNIAIGMQSLFNNTIGATNIAVGSHALLSNTSGFSNVAIGYNSLYSNSSGNENIAIGNYSLALNVTGTKNTAIGIYSLSSNGSGNYCTATGYRTLYFNNNANNNSAFGAEALYNNLSGTGNTAIGASSMINNTIGNYNTTVGFESMHTNTSGNYNSSLGGFSLMRNNNGNYNTGLGYYALSENISGSHNTAVGEYAAPSSTSASYNTSVGIWSLLTNQSGDSNTAIGCYADVNNPNFYNATAIGNHAKAMGSNTIRLGNAAITNIGGQVSWSTSSDGRFKTNLDDYTVGLNFIMKLHPVRYEYTDEGQQGIIYNGFIAQEVEKILDENGWQFSGLCRPSNEKDRYSIRYAEFVVPLVNAVQEQQLILEKYQDEIQELRNENMALKSNYKSLSDQYTELKNQIDELKMLVMKTK
jgi:hypothetical protein